MTEVSDSGWCYNPSGVFPMIFLRILRAALLDQRLYEELRGDPIALVQGLIIVLAASGAAIGAVLLVVANDSTINLTTSQAIGRGLLIMPGVWLMFAASAFAFGTVFKDASMTPVPARDLLVSIMYSSAPGLLLILLAVPALLPLIAVLVPLWQLVALVVALKVTLKTTFMRGVVSVAPGLLLAIIIGITQSGGGSGS